MKAYAETHREIAALMDTPVATVRKWAELPGFPPKGKMGYPMKKVLALRKEIAERKKPKANGDAQTLDGVRIQKELLNCRKLEREIARMDRELIPITDHIQDISRIASLMPQAMDKAISKATVEQRGAEFIAVLEEARDWILAAASEMAEESTS